MWSRPDAGDVTNSDSVKAVVDDMVAQDKRIDVLHSDGGTTIMGAAPSRRRDARPMNRTGTSRDSAKAAVFLASDEAGDITGVCLPVDGGITCKVA